MTDVEYLFKQDIREKKSAGRGIYGKRSGSKTKFCGLPHDNLTPAQLKRRNGPVTTYNISRKLSFYDFKALPLDLKREYLTNLSNTYRASQMMVASSMKIAPSTLSKYLKDCGLSNLMVPGRFAERTDLWGYFMRGEATSLGVAIPPEKPSPSEDAPEPVPLHTVYPESGRVTISGTLDTLDANALLQSLLEKGKTYRVSVEFSLTDT